MRDAPYLPDIEPLLGSLYDCVMAPDGFQGFIRHTCSVFDLKSALFGIRNVLTQEMSGLWVHGMEQKWLDSYALEYAVDDILAHHLRAAPISQFYASNLDLPHPERFPENRFYREWVVPQGMAYAAASIVLREGIWDTQLFVQRGPQHQPFNRGEMETLNRLVPHVQRTIQLRQRFAELQLGQEFLASGLDLLAMPTMLFDDTTRVVHQNAAAQSLLAAGNGLRIVDGHLQASETDVTRRINLEIANAIHAGREGSSDFDGVVLLRRSLRRPLMLIVAPLRTGRRHGALMFAHDPECAVPARAGKVRELFGLSEAESELAVSLCAGRTIDEVAAERGTSRNTIRTQLKSVFQKSGTRRQSDLVSLLLTSPAYFMKS